MFGGFHTMGAAGWVAMALLWVALLAAIVWLIARLTPAGPHEARQPRHEDPREILDRRLAGGEIDSATYEQLRSTLDPRPPVERR